MEISSTLKKIGIDLFFYFVKGARVAAALSWSGRSRTRTMIDYLKTGANPIIEDGKAIAYNAEDIIRGWEVITKAKLTLKNHSKYHAYNIELLNANEIFTEHKKMNKLTSLAPNESIEIDVTFQQNVHYASGIEVDKLPSISKEVEFKVLLI